ncbi:hypothetical protein AAG906_031154 [Vitis piasezkii]
MGAAFLDEHKDPANISLEIRRSSSRYVVSSHDSALLFEIENFNGGWLEIILATEEVVSWTEVIKPLNGFKSIFCPRKSTFSGNTMEPFC